MNNIHSTAIIEKGAKIGKNVKIGPYCIISSNAEKLNQLWRYNC